MKLREQKFPRFVRWRFGYSMSRHIFVRVCFDIGKRKRRNTCCYSKRRNLSFQELFFDINLSNCINTHTHRIQSYIHTYLHTCTQILHTRAQIQTYIHTYIHTETHINIIIHTHIPNTHAHKYIYFFVFSMPWIILRFININQKMH
jgi:hypothetical protein